MRTPAGSKKETITNFSRGIFQVANIKKMKTSSFGGMKKRTSANVFKGGMYPKRKNCENGDPLRTKNAGRNRR